jgi:hypothetical protein
VQLGCFSGIIRTISGRRSFGKLEVAKSFARVMVTNVICPISRSQPLALLAEHLFMVILSFHPLDRLEISKNSWRSNLIFQGISCHATESILGKRGKSSLIPLTY